MPISLIEELKENEINSISYERLGKFVLHFIVEAEINNKTELLNQLGISGRPRAHGASTYTPSRLEVVIDELFRNRLIVSNKIRGAKDQFMLTREGHDSINRDEFRSHHMASSRISNETIHPSLEASRIRFLEGDYVSAISEAMSTVEQRIRSLVPQYKKQLTLAKLVKYVFRRNGILADASNRTKSRAMRGLFLAVLEADVAYFSSNSTEDDLQVAYKTSEIILLANLLHHYLNEYEREHSDYRIHRTPTG